MPLYTVLAPPPAAPAAAPDPVDYVFVKDGFCWPCLFIPEIWMIFRRLWLVLLIYLAVIAVVVALARYVGGPVPLLLLVFIHLFVALQANAFRRWTLTRHGYSLVGVAEGRRVGEAEIRFFHEIEFPRRDPRQPPPDRLLAALGAQGATPAPPIQSRTPSAESGEVVGLFPAPGPSP